eukprot:m51a1_g5031 putative methionine gamma-lyase (425) ;mRNA; f:366557-368144
MSQQQQQHKEEKHVCHPQTAVISKGYQPQWSEGAAVPPVFRTSTFVFRNCQEGKSAFEVAYGLRNAAEGEVPALIYSRVNNPNAEMVEDRIVVWDTADAAALFSSGMAAVTGTCLSFVRPGDEVVFTDPVYGGTEFFLRRMLPQFNVTTRAVPAGCSRAALERAVGECQGRCRLIYVETPANPTIGITDIRMAAAVAKAASTPERPVLLVVDNTFLGPVFCRPHALGADVVLYSATKFIGGHSDVVAGVATGRRELIGAIKGTRTILGQCADPDAAWLLLRSMSTLQMRMRAQQESAQRVVEALAAHRSVERVYYPGHAQMGEEQVRVWREQCTGSGSLISICVRGGEKEAFTFLDHLEHFHLAVSLGGIESLAQHPWSMTHSDMTTEEKLHAGITENMVRLSIGLEDADDLVHEITHALDLIQ